MMNVLLTSAPGVGKTTVARRLLASLRSLDVTVSGFTTKEIREHGQRTGFEVETTEGECHVLASMRLDGPPKVGRYGVDVSTFEHAALPVLDYPADLVIIDELGSMELASAAFCDVVESLFDAPQPVVATVHTRSHPVTDRLKRRSDVDLIEVRRENRDDLPDQLANCWRGSGLD